MKTMNEDERKGRIGLCGLAEGTVTGNGSLMACDLDEAIETAGLNCARRR